MFALVCISVALALYAMWATAELADTRDQLRHTAAAEAKAIKDLWASRRARLTTFRLPARPTHHPQPT